MIGPIRICKCGREYGRDRFKVDNNDSDRDIYPEKYCMCSECCADLDKELMKHLEVVE